MKDWFLKTPLVLLLILICLCGCGIDEFDDEVENDDDNVEVEKSADIANDTKEDKIDQIPIITIEKRIVNNEFIWQENEETVFWRLHTNPVSETDLAVKVNDAWVIITKSQEYSEEFNLAKFDEIIQIYPLPTISVVGIGLVVDIAELNKSLPDDSLGGHTIPKFFDFPLYEVGEPSRIVNEAKIREINRAKFVSESPASGSEITPTQFIRIEFDRDPGKINVSVGRVTGGGKTRDILGPFRLGILELTIEWDSGEGTETLFYSVIELDETKPQIINSSPAQNAKDVDPDDILKNGIVITFTEHVTGRLDLWDNGWNVGWIDKYDENEVTLKGHGGQNLTHETEYEVSGKVQDLAGNTTKVSITFTTKSKD